MFSNRGENRFASHRARAEERFPDIFLHLMGLHLNEIRWSQSSWKEKNSSGTNAWGDHIQENLERGAL